LGAKTLPKPYTINNKQRDLLRLGEYPMWHFRFFGTILTVLALLGFTGSQAALAAYPISPEFSMTQAQEALGLDGSFQLAVMGNGAAPLDIPTKKFPTKVKSEKPAVESPKATPKASQKASKPKKKKVKMAKVKKAPAKESVVEEEEGFFTKTLKTLVGGDGDKKSPASKSLVQKSAGKTPEPVKKEEGLLSKTLSTLVGGDEDKKKSISKPKPQKTAGKKPEPEKKEEGLLTKTFKSLVGSDEKVKKEEKTAKKKSLSSINMDPAAGMTHKKEKEESKTAKSETKKTLKDSFQKLIGVGSIDKEATKPEPEVTKKAEVKKVVEKKAPPQPKRITARKYIEQEDAQLKKDRGGTEKGKNVLKDSFQKLIADDEKQKALTK
jgi:hypothetical protein